MKRNFFIIFTSLVLALGFIAYSKFGKYLPTPKAEFPRELTAIEINHINQHRPITQIKVLKSKRQLQLFSNQLLIRSYPIRLGFNPVGHKIREGDGKTPEGRYQIDWRNPQSAFYKSLHISYPNNQDMAYAQQHHFSAGGNIMIHGSATQNQMQKLPLLRNYLPKDDWTWGCIAVSNRDMDEIWQLVKNQTTIEIYP